jgi:hydroxyethylthiazole kinase-like uncharacterized protein yjeF
MHELLSVEDMRRADASAITNGTSFLALMENAGRAVASEATAMAPAGARIAILCGPGNNGGDGFVSARLLAERGYDVRVVMVTPPESLSGDAAAMAARWAGHIRRQWDDDIAKADLVIDALLGAGLSRPMSGDMAAVVRATNVEHKNRNLPVLAVDIPSGIDGNSGRIVGDVAVRATRTATFFRRKPGHLLMPGRDYCGRIVVADIGIDPAILQVTSNDDQPAIDSTRIAISTWANHPDLWRACWPRLDSDGHKYSRGHAVVVSGPQSSTGAARLGARGALRAGAGLVTVASPMAAVAANAAHLTAIMLAPFEPPDGLADVLADRRRNAVLIGPGCGVGRDTVVMVRHALISGAATVLDADALTSFAGPAASPPDLFAAITANTGRPAVLTPHEGEFRRLFGASSEGASKLERARSAAAISGAVVILKGPDTVIAAPDGRAALNENAPPWLATAGSGDVLAGFVTGLLARGMPVWEAACAGVWLHGAAAQAFGPGLIAEDLPEVLPSVLAPLETAER